MKLKAIFAACISLMVMSSSANAGNLDNGEHGISARATSAKQLVDVYAGGNYVSISSSNMAIMFDIDNRDPERAATVDATCTIHYDQAQRFLFQSTPTPPDTISGTLFRSGNGNKFQSMWPGQNTGFLFLRVSVMHC